MATVYILYSKSLDSFYTGSCLDFNTRLDEHNSHSRKAFTNKASDWKCFWKLDQLEYNQARTIERHIKRMKSKSYIQNLALYPEMSARLVIKYSD